MDPGRAWTEAAIVYKAERDRLDGSVRVGEVAYGLLKQKVGGSDGDRVLGALYTTFDSARRPIPRVPNPESVIEIAHKKNVILFVTAVQTEFEFACRSLLAEVFEFWPEEFQWRVQGVKPATQIIEPLGKRGWLGPIGEYLKKQSAGEDFLRSCYAALGLENHEDDLKILPAFEYFRRLRNRVVHQDGTPGKDLVEYSRQQKVRKAVSAVQRATGSRAQELPVLVADELAALDSRHVILFLIVARKLFERLSARVASHLPIDGYIRMAAHYAYATAHHDFRHDNYRMVDEPLRHFLYHRYRIRPSRKDEFIAYLRQVELWEHIVARFHQLFPKRA